MTTVTLNKFFERFIPAQKKISEEKSLKVVENSDLLVRFFRDATANNASVQVINGLHWTNSKSAMNPHPHVTVSPFTARSSYVAAMHELGHLVGPWQKWDHNTILEMEAGAWKWARENIYDWCVEDGKLRRECLQSYLDALEVAKAEGYDKHPSNGQKFFPEPEPNHYFWQCMKSDMA